MANLPAQHHVLYIFKTCLVRSTPNNSKYLTVFAKVVPRLSSFHGAGCRRSR
jgi:hypothetical protein